jgi:hypothetical protein
VDRLLPPEGVSAEFPPPQAVSHNDKDNPDVAMNLCLKIIDRIGNLSDGTDFKFKK